MNAFDGLIAQIMICVGELCVLKYPKAYTKHENKFDSLDAIVLYYIVRAEFNTHTHTHTRAHGTQK